MLFYNSNLKKLNFHPLCHFRGMSLLLTYILTYLLSYLLSPYSTVLLEKLTGLQPVKKFPAFYGTRRFITAFTSARHLSLSWARWIQSIPPYPTSWRSILISSHRRLGLSLRFPHQNLYAPLLSPYALHAPPIPLISSW